MTGTSKENGENEMRPKANDFMNQLMSFMSAEMKWRKEDREHSNDEEILIEMTSRRTEIEGRVRSIQENPRKALQLPKNQR